jgi:hypothetical protein
LWCVPFWPSAVPLDGRIRTIDAFETARGVLRTQKYWFVVLMRLDDSIIIADH